MTRTIVVPIAHAVEESKHLSTAAIPTARAMAERTRARIVLVTAIDASVHGPQSSSVTESRVVADAKRELSNLAEQIPNSPVETIAYVGNPTDVILAVLTNVDDPILVVSSHARQGVRRMFHGSVAFRLVHKAPCPVVVVKGSNADDAPVLPANFSRVLVPLDRSPFAEAAFKPALAAFGKPALHVHLLHIVEPLAYPASARADVFQMVKPGAEDYLQGVADRLVDRGYQVTVEVRSGQAAEQILRTATEQQVDMIVMATHGLSGVERRFLGSTAEHVLAKSSVPLVLIRPDESVLATIREESDAEREARVEAIHTPPPTLWEHRAESVMTTPAIVAGEETPLVDIVSKMLSEGIGCMPIVDRNDQLVGIVTESDFVNDDIYVPLAAYQVPQVFEVNMTEEMLERLYAAGREMTAAQIMSHPVISVTDDEPVGAVVARMMDRKLKRLPVVRRGIPVGIVTRHDLLKLLVPSQIGETSAAISRHTHEATSR